MSYEQQLQSILKEVTQNDADRKQYADDAKTISNFIMTRMRETNRDFGRCFHGTSLTGSYLNYLEINKPDEFDIHLILYLPGIVIWPHQLQGHMFLRTTGPSLYSCERIMKHKVRFFISRYKLQSWLRKIFIDTFPRDSLEVNFANGQCFKLEYSKSNRGYSLAHTFHATALYAPYRKIKFNFIPAFQFNQSEWIFNKMHPPIHASWYAVPSSHENKFSFMVCAPHLEHELLKVTYNLTNSLRLLKAIRDKNRMSLISSYLIKSLYLGENEYLDTRFWQQPVGVVLIFMIKRLVVCLENKEIPLYWGCEVNLFDRLRWNQRQRYITKFQNILVTLEWAQQNQMLFDERLENIFL